MTTKLVTFLHHRGDGNAVDLENAIKSALNRTKTLGSNAV
jgi:hypothetical protein